jgi:predicted nucleotide-binding protein
MATMPIEVVDMGEIAVDMLDQAILTANSLQTEFNFSRLSDIDASRFRMHSFHEILADHLLDDMDRLRLEIKGYHPFLIALTDARLNGERFSNLFAANRSERGLGIVTTANVVGTILPADRLASYFLYYLAHQTLGFLAPEHKNHDDSRNCVFDRKIYKPDLLATMRSRALCDQCRTALLTVQMLSANQLSALDKLYSASGALIGNVPSSTNTRTKPRMFVGSSVEGLRVANEIQNLLQYDADVEVWNQGTIFGLGSATLEALEVAVLTYDCAVFVFTPDDELHSRGQIKPVARDNVVFELGLFVGKLTRRRAFIVQPTNRSVALPSDLAGITTALYDPDRSNLAAALGPACQRIRGAISQQTVGTRR